MHLIMSNAFCFPGCLLVLLSWLSALLFNSLFPTEQLSTYNVTGLLYCAQFFYFF